MSVVNFPDKRQVVSEVDVVKHAHSIRKRAFLNAVNRNKIAGDMRPEMIYEHPDQCNRSHKTRVWVEKIDEETKNAIRKTIKVLPYEEKIENKVQPREHLANVKIDYDHDEHRESGTNILIDAESGFSQSIPDEMMKGLHQNLVEVIDEVPLY